MLSEINALQQKMESGLKGVLVCEDPLLRYRNAVGFLLPVLESLRGLLVEGDLLGGNDLVIVYKKTVPLFYAQYIFYASLHNLHLQKPFGTREKEYYLKESERIENWFAENEAFLRYYRSGQTHLDKEYFLPAGDSLPLYLDVYAPMMQGSICSRYVFIAAMGMAYQRLQKELTLLLIAASGVSFSFGSFRWTLSKTDLTELIYALFACSAFNKGKASIKDITRFFEEVLQISLGNTSVTFQEILRRKDSTVFLSRLSDAFENYIDQVEQKNIR